ncbi:transcriptional regulator, ArsR family [Archaeoglobus sulfaticallidus PM70-1]|uniref:Transcriptional regulator, ArsR family n=1 Tax=Archaeoglobus sulfaticallidus PM70-1 TaxID=387631 RepID=N0BLE4_9EURY|nr:ArsR family transcriptional regulator [Archaeoglobus sulfaticallidus]AGK61000.1 transcriptional regulator, ArsR family [Archaeoglobus sulfaticallidus PM70-1]
MAKRAKLVNDIVELVPILQIFSTKTYREVYESLLEGWMTYNELRDRFGDSVDEALKILKHAGMLEVKWRMPKDPGDTPQKEYHVSYTHLSANFYTSLKDLNKILEVIFLSDDELEKIVSRIIEEINMGRMSVPHISRSLQLDPLFIRATAKKSLKLNIKGQLVELSKDEEI